MNFVKWIQLKVTSTEYLLIVSGLDYIIADQNRLYIDRALAEKTRQRFINMAEQEGIVIHGD